VKISGLGQKLLILFLAARPKFLTASAMPVLVGSAMGYAAGGTFQPVLFILALFGIMALHAGANIANDYFDHISRNDWVNTNVTPFSGGRRFIQDGILSARATLLASLFCLALGAALGVAILLITQSIFILILGVIGLVGGFFYTAPPIKLGYRGIGEFVIAFLFGILPVYGSYYLQTGIIDVTPLLTGCIVGILIFLVILVNEFPDLQADAAVNKITLVVRFGVSVGVRIYRVAVVSTFGIAVASVLVSRLMLWPCILYFLFGAPVAFAALIFANTRDLSTTGPTQHRASAITIFLHLIGCLALSAGFLIWSFVHAPMS
jgi:1,4-dihydroxy-2-naphthoate octaprenyltransferase